MPFFPGKSTNPPGFQRGDRAESALEGLRAAALQRAGAQSSSLGRSRGLKDVANIFVIFFFKDMASILTAFI